MKNNNIAFIVLAFFVITSLSSCKTVSYQARGIDIDNQMIEATPTVVDIRVDMDKRITYHDEDFVKYSQSAGQSQTEELALNAAKYACITRNNIDILVDPIYKITFRGKKKAKIEITGLAGYYTNARSLFQDVKSLETFSMDDVKKYIIFNNPQLIKSDASSVNVTITDSDKK